MTAGSDADSGSHSVCDMKEPDKEGGKNTSKSSGDDNSYNSDRDHAGKLLGNTDGNRGCHRLWNKGVGNLIIQTPQAAHQIDAPHGGKGAAGASDDNRKPVFF